MTQRPDQNAFQTQPGGSSAEALVVEHWAGVYRLMYRLTSNSHDAEDLTQQSFLQAIEKFNQFQPGTNLRSWLLRIATNCFLDNRRRRRPNAVDGSTLDVAHAAPAIGEKLEQAELAGQLQEALLKLPENQRVIFLLRSTEDVSFREIGELLGMTEVTARWHMLQARTRLLELLKGKW
ncbi:MAG TPA: sigma-70 family RNA polymerase sigma factor [Tepidisphaeraceae bacterium]|nr:sigma-70 family RNA polymerase sigma factor [Tepidisphaeraceae bacterium]